MLGGGIGISAALFAVVDAFALRPVSVPHPESLRFIQWRRPEGSRFTPRLSLDEFQYLQRLDLPVRALAATRGEVAIVRSQDFVVTAPGEAVIGDYFATLGASPAAGRFFDASESEGAVVLSSQLARRLFGDASHAIGQGVRLRSPGYSGVYDDRSDDYTVIGVARDDLAGARGIWQRTDYWIPARTRPDPDRPDTTVRLRSSFRGVARLPDDRAAAERLDAALALAGGRLYDAAADGQRRSDWGNLVADTRPELRLPVVLGGNLDASTDLARVLLLVVGLVLATAIANTFGYLRAQFWLRRDDTIVRTMLGATVTRVCRESIAEVFFVTGIAGVAGTAIALALVRIVTASIPTEFSGSRALFLWSPSVPIDWRVIAFAIGVTMITATLVSSAYVVSMTEIARQPRRWATSVAGSRLSRSVQQLVLLPQVAGTATLIVVAIAVGVEAVPREAAAPGYALDRLAYVDFELPRVERGANINEYVDARERIDDAVSRAGRATPGVAGVALTNSLPTYPMSTFIVTHEGAATRRSWTVNEAWITDDYFDVAGIAVNGRQFAVGDGKDAPLVAIVSKRLANLLWPGQSALGRYVAFTPQGDVLPSRWMEIVGIAGDVTVPGLASDPLPLLYLPLRQQSSPYVTTLLVRGDHAVTSLSRLAAMVAARVAQVDASVNVSHAQALKNDTDLLLYPTRVAFSLIAAGAGFAVLLCVAGLYGTITQIASDRAREMAIRMALGAGVAQIGRRVLGSTLVVAAGGMVVGLLSGALLMRWAWIATGLPLRLRAGNVAATALCVLAAVILSALTPLRRVITQQLTTVLNE